VTQAERASLERLEDAITTRLDRIEGKVDGIDVRLRVVETVQARHEGADEQKAAASSGRVQSVGMAVSIGMLLFGLPASVWAILNVIQAVSG